eukprot:m.82653 g.82653  ORF g.82653 m.82653 type:complete len:154 (-) comp50784_c0_seq2:94-555(-)
MSLVEQRMVRQSKSNASKKHLYKKYRTRRRTKDLDQILLDAEPEAYQKLKNQPVDGDLPGLAQHYCVACSRYFQDQQALVEHMRSKIHKRRLKALEMPAYTTQEAEAAAGLGTYVAPQKQDVPAPFKEEMTLVDEVIAAEAVKRKLAEQPTVE